MSPENLETRVVRLETRGERWDLTVPLLGEVAVIDERVDGMKDDVNKGFAAVRAEMTEFKQEMRGELGEIKRDDKTKARERRALHAGLFLASFGLIGTFLLQLWQGSGHG